MSILIIEDDADMLDILCFTVRRSGHEVIAAHNGAVGLDLWRSKNPELVLLDVGLPKLSGWDVCKAIRSESRTPVIMLTAADEDEDVVRGLELGADDYVTKPFSPKELMARIRAVLRRAQESAEEPRKGWQAITVGDLKLDPQWRTINRAGREVRLTATEFKILYELVVHEGQVLTHQILTDRVWGYEGVDDAGLLKGHIRNLRRKIEVDSSKPAYIQTVSGVGYTFRRNQGETV
jgi:DNA-binding response OmpR family regulator